MQNLSGAIFKNNSMAQPKITGCLLAILFTCYLGFSFSTALAQPKKPNIIFILTDDHRWDALGVMGNPIIQTPNLDLLARQGRLYKNAYVTTSICCVSRASILTGQYESRHHINDFKTDFSPEQLANTFPLLLKQSGYMIGAVGKYGVAIHRSHVAGYDYWTCSSKVQPDYVLNRANGEKIHNTDSVANDAQNFIEHAAGNKPFFLWVGFKAPHELDGDPPTYVVQDRFKKLYSDMKISRAVTNDDKYWNALPPFFHEPKDIARKRYLGLFGTDSLYQENVKNYYRLISGVDEVVGKIRDGLRAKGLDKNTIIVFMGDNGFYLGEHGLEGKWFGHEESIRVPLIVYDPRLAVAEKAERQPMILNIDIAPTLLAYAGVKVPLAIQGTNINAKKVWLRNAFYYEHHFAKAPEIPQVEGIVGKRYKYFFYPEFNYEELFDLQNDPHETKNVVAKAEYQTVLNKLRDQYKHQRKQAP